MFLELIAVAVAGFAGAGAIMALRLVLQLWGYAVAIASGSETPVAVPLVKSAAEQAAEEAEHVSSLDR